MTKHLFTGLCTALVTPFYEGKVNFPMLEVLLRRQIEAGIETVVLAGTTGESPTLTTDEKLELFARGVKAAEGRCKIIAGTGSNSTASAVELSRRAADVGVDGLLVVTPYYNKSTQPGLVKYYRAVAESVRIPVIAYNVPSRTGVDISVDTCGKLAQMEHLAGIKEACGDISKVGRILAGSGLTVYSGNDDQTVPMMAMGAAGVISVASNVVPEQMKALTNAALAGDYRLAAQLQRRLLPLMELLFCQVNPIPVKAAMAMIGYDAGDCRPPLDDLTNQNAQKLRACLDGLDVCDYNK